jgi:hypothetical protein
MRTRLVPLFLVALLVAACAKKPRWYEADVRLNRIQTIRFDAKGIPADVDVEVQYDECPGGQQLEIVRGDAAFAQCMKRHAPGAKVVAKIEHHWDDRGFWDWDIHELGGCKRPPDKDDINSFDTVQECEPIVSNGVNEGFRCNRIPQRELLKKCPWFGRR